MTHTDMSKPFSSNPKLEHWVPSEQQIQTITAARELWDLVPEEKGDDLNLFQINALDVRSHLHPEVTDPQQLLDLTKELVAEFQEATQIVGFFEKDDEMRTIKRQIKRSILDRAFGSKDLVAEVTDRFMDLAKVRFK